MTLTLKDIQSQVAVARAQALAESKQAHGRRGFHRSRGVWLCASNDRDILVGEGDYQWRGTLREINEFIAAQVERGATSVYLDSGYDFCERFDDVMNGDYEGHSADWSIDLL